MFSRPSHYSLFISRYKNVTMWVISSSQTNVSPFQRQKLEEAEEESRRTAKTMQGKYGRCIFNAFNQCFSALRWLLQWIFCFLPDLEQSVEQTKKDYETLKEESQCRERELNQVRSHMQSVFENNWAHLLKRCTSVQLSVPLSGAVVPLYATQHPSIRYVLTMGLKGNFFKFSTNIHLDSSMKWLEFGSQRSMRDMFRL